MLSQLKLLGIYQRELSKNHGCAGAALEAVAQAAVKDAVGGDEPVGWQYRETRDDGTWSAWIGCCVRLEENDYRQCRPLYTRPQASAAVPEGWKLSVFSLTEAARCLGVAQERNDSASIDHWSRESQKYEREMLAASQPEVKS